MAIPLDDGMKDVVLVAMDGSEHWAHRAVMSSVSPLLRDICHDAKEAPDGGCFRDVANGGTIRVPLKVGSGPATALLVKLVDAPLIAAAAAPKERGGTLRASKRRMAAAGGEAAAAEAAAAEAAAASAAAASAAAASAAAASAAEAAAAAVAAVSIYDLCDLLELVRYLGIRAGAVDSAGARVLADRVLDLVSAKIAAADHADAMRIVRKLVELDLGGRANDVLYAASLHALDLAFVPTSPPYAPTSPAHAYAPTSPAYSPTRPADAPPDIEASQRELGWVAQRARQARQERQERQRQRCAVVRDLLAELEGSELDPAILLAVAFANNASALRLQLSDADLAALCADYARAPGALSRLAYSFNTARLKPQEREEVLTRLAESKGAPSMADVALLCRRIPFKQVSVRAED